MRDEHGERHSGVQLKDVARKIAGAIWGAPETPPVDQNQDNEG
ncbi:hypothetical protein ACFV2X_43815 [Streptomyces sp. NPDC059679]